MGLFGADKSATLQDVKIAPSGTLYDQSRAVASKFGSKVGLTKGGLLDGRLKLTAGIDTLSDKGKQDMYLTGRTFVPESKYTNLSLFTQGEFKIFDTLTLHAGVRRENADLKVDSYRTLAAYKNTFVEGGKIKFNETLANAGLVLTPVKDVTVYASYSEGFGLPDIGRTLRSINTPGQKISNMRNSTDPDRRHRARHPGTQGRLGPGRRLLPLRLGFRCARDLGQRCVQYGAREDPPGRL